MIIVLKPNISKENFDYLVNRIKKLGLEVDISKGKKRTIVGVIGEEDVIRTLPLEAVPGVEKVIPVLKPYKLASREEKSEDTVIKIKDNIVIGGKEIIVMAGPCAVENKACLFDIAKEVKSIGAKVLRGGAFKPRTSPYAFQGLGLKGLKYLHEVGRELGLAIITETMDTREVHQVEKYADIIQIGARNMQNFDLLKEVGACRKPVLLKRGMSSTIKDLLMSAEYILSEGNPNVMLCERGIRTFETATRNTLDLSLVPIVKKLSHLPIVVDPSHATGKWNLILPMSKAAIAAGADGLMVEVHTKPEEALSDGIQSLKPEKFQKVIEGIRPVAEAVGRSL